MNLPNTASSDEAMASEEVSLMPMTRRHLALWSCFLAIAFSGIVGIPSLRQADLAISKNARAYELAGDLEKAIHLSESFAHGSGVVTIFLILLVVDKDKRRRLWNVAAYVLIVGLLANALKYLIPRLRPHSGVEISDITTTWLPLFSGVGRKSVELSFPSGHTATAIAFAIALSIVYPRGRYLFVTIALLASWQRIYSGAHYPSDCLGGATIALLVASGWYSFWRTTKNVNQ